MRDSVKEVALELESRIIGYGGKFEDLLMEVFQFQAVNCGVYKAFLNYLKVDYRKVNKIEAIPYLPISAFKYHKVGWGGSAELVFKSSGTSGMERSMHYVHRSSVYGEGVLRGFEQEWGRVEDWVILALLPSYLEQGQSSLVWMVDHLMQRSAKRSAFFKQDFESLNATIEQASQKGRSVLLWGVAYALLDFAEWRNQMLPEGITVLETGGMKGRRKELPKEGLHQALTEALGVKVIASEYGMTELLSQAWSKQGNGFIAGPFMDVSIAHNQNPMEKVGVGVKGRLMVCDLLNVHSCSFVATDDLAQLNTDGSFSVLGRLDNAEIRGCNLLYEL